MEDKFGYKVTDKATGFDEAVWDLSKGDRLIHLLYNEADGVELHPMDKAAEKDALGMVPYLKEILESQYQEEE